ncbi:CNT_HP2_G0014100.mRNA.1.CDS.1 [Saccharomyces cerevisiae]|nr:CNT_HP2_G0014100.mRNA.1.CDS.1 [Saccharomyces cerevisiae]CAI6564397.1 CNT_HP2_G0014100.mRNA.1.CDS.1 [Saccharomyces cerevisiae]
MDGSTGEFRQVDFLQSNHNSSTMFCYPVQNSKLRISILEAKSGFLRKKKNFLSMGSILKRVL